MTKIALYRRLYRELRATGSLVPTWDYVVKRTRGLHRGTDTKTQDDDLELLTIYVEYLENSRLHKELIGKHSGRGERSVEDSAKIVGLKLPHEPRTT